MAGGKPKRLNAGSDPKGDQFNYQCAHVCNQVIVPFILFPFLPLALTGCLSK